MALQHRHDCELSFFRLDRTVFPHRIDGVFELLLGHYRFADNQLLKRGCMPQLSQQHITELFPVEESHFDRELPKSQGRCGLLR